jgi:hypothetical protein
MEIILKGLGLIALVILLAILMAWPTMLLWNWLMPSIFGVIKITFWQALGINLLTGIFRSSVNTKK